eukprot:Amastigsp_a1309_61.p7 type:complete len:141 gc:universal Amastigsp_a1309_61:2115-1693(-)
MGLAIKSSMPASTHRCRSSIDVCAVHAMMGTATPSPRRRSMLRIMRVASRPSMSGRLQSIKMQSKLCAEYSCTHVVPDDAVSTLKPRSWSMTAAMMRFTASSSTRSTMPLVVAPTSWPVEPTDAVVTDPCPAGAATALAG